MASVPHFTFPTRTAPTLAWSGPSAVALAGAGRASPPATFLRRVVRALRDELGFAPRRTVEDAIRDLVVAFKAGRIPDPDHERYYNIKTMQRIRLT